MDAEHDPIPYRWLSARNNSGAAYYRNMFLKKYLAAQWHTCPICGCHMEPVRGKTDEGFHITFDHVIPKSKGGPDRFGNLLLSHSSCNSMKADKVPSGCQLVWLLAVNARLGFSPQSW